jgi:hypothetical protein
MSSSNRGFRIPSRASHASRLVGVATILAPAHAASCGGPLISFGQSILNSLTGLHPAGEPMTSDRVDVESLGAFSTMAQRDMRPSVESRGAQILVDDSRPRLRVERLAADARATRALPPGVEGSGVVPNLDSARPKGEEATLVSHLRAAAGAKLVLASVVAALFGAMCRESRYDLYLGAASTALALVGFWLAEHELGRGGVRFTSASPSGSSTASAVTC